MYSVRVRGDSEKTIGTLQVFKGDEVADSVVAFSVRHGLDTHQIQTLTKVACAEVACLRSRALLYETQVELEKTTDELPTLRVWHGQSPEDAIAFYVQAAELPLSSEGILVDALCRAGESASLPALKPNLCRKVSLRIPINSDEDGNLGELQVRQGEEPADAVRSFALNRISSESARRQLVEVACSRAFCGRKRAIAFTASPVRGPDGRVLVDDENVPFQLTVWDGQEPADAVYQFAQQTNNITYLRNLTDEVCGKVDSDKKDFFLPRRTNGLVKCGRNRGILRTVPIRGPFGKNKEDVHVGDMAIVDEAEAYDLAYAFAAQRGCEGCPFYYQLAASICDMTLCTRKKAIAWSMTLHSVDLDALGWPTEQDEEAVLRVWEGEQLVDGVRSLWFDRYDVDDREARRRMASTLCANSLARPSLCSRAEEILAMADVESPKSIRTTQFNSTRRFPKNSSLLDFGILGWYHLQALGVRNDSEADVRDIGRGFKVRKVNDVEATESNFPDLFNQSLPINVTFQIVDDGNKWLPGRVVVYEGSTASDAVYAACRANELLQPNYTATGLQQQYLEEICQSPYPSSLPKNSIPGCDQTPPYYDPREHLFELPLSYNGMGHTFRYYAQDTVETATQEYCARLGQPRDCERDLRTAIEAQLDAFESKRFSETATPDGPDLYVALSVPRDASNETIVAAYSKLAAELREPFQAAKAELADAQEFAANADGFYRAAAMLVGRANATATVTATLAERARSEILELSRRRLLDSLRVKSEEDRRLVESLEAMFASSRNETHESTLSVSTALKAIENVTGTTTRNDANKKLLDALVAQNFVLRHKPPQQHRRRHQRTDQQVDRIELTSDGRATLEDYQKNGHERKALDWPTVARLVAEVRVVVASLTGFEVALSHCQRKLMSL